MEFRDGVAAISAIVAIVTFLSNWLRNRGFERTIRMRDELVSFADNSLVAERVKPEVVEAARDASLLLSLDLAESARRLAVKRAERAAAVVKRIILAGVATLGAVVLFVFAALFTPATNSVDYWIGVIYFAAISAVSIAAFIIYWRDALRIRSTTGKLMDLRNKVRKGTSLERVDLKGSRSTAQN